MRAVLAVELRKLAAQPRVRVLALVLLAAPWLFIVVLLHQDRLPVETIYGRYLKTTGFATPMVILATATQWVFPLVAAVVPGDIFSSEDAHGTYKTILTRSVTRHQVFWGKVVAAVTTTWALVLLTGASALAAGLVAVGDQPFVDVGSRTVAPGRATWLVTESWLSVLPPVLAFSVLAIFVSILTRSSLLGVIVPVLVGLAAQLYTLLNAWDGLRHVLINAPFHAWRGLLDSPAYAGPFERGLLVSLGYVVVLLVPAYVVFRRRDVVGR